MTLLSSCCVPTSCLIPSARSGADDPKSVSTAACSSGVGGAGCNRKSMPLSPDLSAAGQRQTLPPLVVCGRDLVHANGGGFEFRRAGFGVGSVDRQEIGSYFILKV